MKNIKIFVLSFVIIFTSCEKEVREIKMPKVENKQVLAAFFTDEQDTLRLYLSSFVSATASTQSKGIETADVGLYLNDTLLVKFESEGEGFYAALSDSLLFLVGRKYEIRSKAAGFPDIFAKATFLPEVRPDSLRFRVLDDRDGVVDLFYKDRQGDDYYGFFRAWFYEGDSLISRDGASIDLISDVLFDNQMTSARIEVANVKYLVNIGQPDTKIVGTLVHIEKVWYDYEQALEINSPIVDDFLDFHSTDNVPSNVVGGYGIFGLGNVGILEKKF